MKTEITLVEIDDEYIATFRIGGIGYVARIEIETLLPEKIHHDAVHDYLLNDYLDRVD